MLNETGLSETSPNLSNPNLAKNGASPRITSVSPIHIPDTNEGPHAQLVEIAKQESEISEALKNSTWIQILQERKAKGEPLRLAFLDVDSTLTGDNRKMGEVLQKLKDVGYVVFLVSSRMEEMFLPDDANHEEEIQRPNPQLSDVHRNESPLLRDPNYVQGIAGTTGTNIIFHEQNGKYTVDQPFKAETKSDSRMWKKTMWDMVHHLKAEQYLSYMDVDDPDIYTDPNFRLILDFEKDEDRKTVSHEENLIRQKEFKDKIREFKRECAQAYALAHGKELANLSPEEKEKRLELLKTYDEESLKAILNVRINTDSNPNSANANLILSPSRGTKDHAVGYVINETAKALKALGIEDIEFDHIFYAGDSFADFKAGLYAGDIPEDDSEDALIKRSNATYFVPAGSRMSGIFSQIEEYSRKKELGQEASPPRFENAPAYGNVTSIGIGKYESRHAASLRETEVIVADEAYHDNQTSAPASILRYLEEKYS